MLFFFPERLCETTHVMGHFLDVTPFEFAVHFSNPSSALWAVYCSQMDTEIILKDLEKVPFAVS